MRLAHWLKRFRAPAAPPARRRTAVHFRPRLESLERRDVPSTLLVSPTGLFGTTPTPFTTVQSAVNAAAVGDTILVGPGTYAEQVLITKNSLTLTSSTPLAAIIKAPTNNDLAGDRAIVDIKGATGVVLDSFTISGPGPTSNGAPGALYFGVYVDGGASATIQNNHITRIVNSPYEGGSTGDGIHVGLAAT